MASLAPKRPSSDEFIITPKKLQLVPDETPFDLAEAQRVERNYSLLFDWLEAGARQINDKARFKRGVLKLTTIGDDAKPNLLKAKKALLLFKAYRDELLALQRYNPDFIYRPGLHQRYMGFVVRYDALLWDVFHAE